MLKHSSHRIIIRQPEMQLTGGHACHRAAACFHVLTSSKWKTCTFLQNVGINPNGFGTFPLTPGQWIILNWSMSAVRQISCACLCLCRFVSFMP